MSETPERKTINLWYSLHAAEDAGEERHAQWVMGDLAERHGFRIVEAIPQSIADGWQFVVEVNEPIEWPEYIREMGSDPAPEKEPPKPSRPAQSGRLWARGVRLTFNGHEVRGLEDDQ